MKESQSQQLEQEIQAQSQYQNEPKGAKASQQIKLIGFGGVLLLIVVMSAGYYLLLMKTTSKLDSSLRILDRSEWKGEPPTGLYARLKAPVSHVIIHHTASEGCESENVCIYRVRLIQTFHMQSIGWTDIGYNFLVGGDGQVYVGRGWYVQGQHVKGFEAVSLSIAFIGTFSNTPPPTQQINAAKQLMEEGVRLHKLHPDYHIYAHRQLSATESPGLALFELMKHWPRWSQSVGALRLLSNDTLKFVPRNYWLAQPAQQQLEVLELPAKRVQFVSTQTEPCLTQAECTFRVRRLQSYHMESLHLPDINYNFIVGGDGQIYIGRNWEDNCDALQGKEAFNGLVVAFLGEAQPEQNQIDLARKLLARGVQLGKLVKDFELIDNLKDTYIK